MKLGGMTYLNRLSMELLPKFRWFCMVYEDRPERHLCRMKVVIKAGELKMRYCMGDFGKMANNWTRTYNGCWRGVIAIPINGKAVDLPLEIERDEKDVHGYKVDLRMNCRNEFDMRDWVDMEWRKRCN